MRLLIMTQAVDKKHPILGFFHRWIAEMAVHAESIVVIGQQVGDYDFPENVTVHSLRKEDGASILSQILRFWQLCFSLRGQYDSVLVHMTPVWIVLGSLPWLLLRKSMYLWYEVRRGGWMLRIALLFVRRVFSASEKGLPWPSSKQLVLGHGIDVAEFAPSNEVPTLGKIITVGRVTRIKNLERIVETLRLLPEMYHLEIIGDTVTDEDNVYKKELEEMVEREGLAGRVRVGGFITNAQMPAAMQSAALVIQCADGGLDKAILEAMACGTPVVSSSIAARGILPESYCTTHEGLAETVHLLLERLAKERESIGQELREIIVEGHSHVGLIGRMMGEMAMS